jgi:hypothetical protein
MNKWFAILGVVTSAALFSPAFAGDDTATPLPDSNAADASLELTGGAVAAGIGYVWGDGSFTFRGQKHEFTLNGLSIVDVGASSISASGEVYHLNSLSDFDGNYVTLSAGATIAGGADAIYLQNQHGVVIKLATTAIGLRFNLAAGGVNLALKS